MANRSILCTAAIVLTFLATIPATLAQSPSFDKTNAVDSTSGIRTDRLTTKQLRIWGEIEKIVQAVDEAGRPLHPTLQGLWQRVQSGGHTIFIEMKEKQAAIYAAGITTLEERNCDGNQKVVVIWLHLWAMDNAFVNPKARRSNGLIRFNGLSRYERYAEVLGHELAHAVLTLEDPEYARLGLEYRAAATGFLLAHKRVNNAADAEEALQLRSLGEKIEKPAEAAELEIWRELLGDQRMGARAGAGWVIGRTAMLTDMSRAN